MKRLRKILMDEASAERFYNSDTQQPTGGG